jgi:hypothetical protein
MTIVPFGFISCSEDEDDNGDGTANVEISMSNTVSGSREYQEVNIDLMQVSIHSSSDSSSSSGWVDLETNQGIYNLMDFTSGNDTILAFDSVLIVQKISQIRLVLGDNNTVVENGETYDLDTPSAQTSGLKISVNATLEPGQHYIIQLDFNPDESIVKTGNGKYKLQPVIDAIVIQE